MFGGYGIFHQGLMIRLIARAGESLRLLQTEQNLSRSR